MVFYKIGRLQRKVEKMTIFIEELKANQLISPSCADLLEASCSGIPQLIMERLLTGRQPSRGHAYHEEMKAFALTLHFYSAKAIIDSNCFFRALCRDDLHTKKVIYLYDC